jgi:hypothetical protein
MTNESLIHKTLLPCPFCGSHPAQYQDTTNVTCADGDCPAYDMACSPTEWNTRHSSPMGESLVEKLEKAKWNDDYCPECSGRNSTLDDAIAIVRQHQADAVCPYVVTSSSTFEGDGGTSYCRLAEQNGPAPAEQPQDVFERVKMAIGVLIDNSLEKCKEGTRNPYYPSDDELAKAAIAAMGGVTQSGREVDAPNAGVQIPSPPVKPSGYSELARAEAQSNINGLTDICASEPGFGAHDSPETEAERGTRRAHQAYKQPQDVRSGEIPDNTFFRGGCNCGDQHPCEYCRNVAREEDDDLIEALMNEHDMDIPDNLLASPDHPHFKAHRNGVKAMLHFLDKHRYKKPPEPVMSKVRLIDCVSAIDAVAKENWHDSITYDSFAFAKAVLDRAGVPYVD